MSRLVIRATSPGLGRATKLASTLREVDVDAVVEEYVEMIALAPRRGLDGHDYFVFRKGAPLAGASSNRREEQLAMALVNDGAFITLETERVDLLMYTFPLFTTGGPNRIRSVDLVAHSHGHERFWVVELKAPRAGRGDGPLRALYEALVYAAVVEANSFHITNELVEKHGRASKMSRPGLMVAAPSCYWERWRPTSRTGDWWFEYVQVTSQLAGRLATPVVAIDLGAVDFLTGLDGRPHLVGTLAARPVSYS